MITFSRAYTVFGYIHVQSMNHISLKVGLDIKVTHCAGCLSANARPHWPRWGDQEMGSVFSCTKYCWVDGLIQMT